MSKKRNDKASDLLNAKTKPNQSFFVYCIQYKENIFLRKKELFKGKEKWRIEQKQKNKSIERKLFNCSRYGD